MNVCFLRACFPDPNKFIQELVNDYKKMLNVCKINIP